VCGLASSSIVEWAGTNVELVEEAMPMDPVNEYAKTHFTLCGTGFKFEMLQFLMNCLSAVAKLHCTTVSGGEYVVALGLET
jgi:hypothetical protein